jgi:metal-responsive CopG/Arc/MetJ family transcriptional regulator
MAERCNLNLSLDPKLLERIETFWHLYRFRSRTEAIRWLLEAALNKKLEPDEK